LRHGGKMYEAFTSAANLYRSNSALGISKLNEHMSRVAVSSLDCKQNDRIQAPVAVDIS